MASLSKTVQFHATRFPESTLRDAIEALTKQAELSWIKAFRELEKVRLAAPEEVDRDWFFTSNYLYPVPTDSGTPSGEVIRFSNLDVSSPEVSWGFDDPEDFFSELRRGHEEMSFSVSSTTGVLRLEASYHFGVTRIRVEHDDRRVIQMLSGIFERDAKKFQTESGAVVSSFEPKIFIGHGGNGSDWLELQNQLQNVHGLYVESFESGARAGHHIRDILARFLDENNFALLIMSKADEQKDGSMRARQNVIHEAGLFQGRLGFNRAILLIEEGVDTFSNIAGIQYISFSSGQITGTVGEILAAINRERGAGSGDAA